jgi:hypothetical protein
MIGKRIVIILEPDGTFRRCEVDVDQVLIVQGDGRTVLDFPTEQDQFDD